jgi:hypothetical protein
VESNRGVTVVAFAEHRTTSGWTIEPSAMHLPTLTAVDCPDTWHCQAVGEAGSPLHRRGQGTSWLAVSATPPTGAAFTRSLAVSCGDSSHCLAVGYSQGASGDAPFAMSWDGSRWTSVPGATALAPAGMQADLYAVSCVAATDCIAVGDTFTEEQTDYHALAARWNGSTWSALTVPASTAILRGVACSSISECTAVGNGAIERWNGSAWRTEGANVAGHLMWLNAITCRNATDCTAVGIDNNTFPVAIHRSANTWSVQPIQHTKTLAGLWGVSCASSSSCIATGVYDLTDSDLQGPVAERWNGQHWTLINPPPPDAGGPGELTTVSCVAHTQCWAVGGFGSREMELWNGSAWSKVALPGSGYTLEAVSCLPSQPCVAVGTQALRYG